MLRVISALALASQVLFPTAPPSVSATDAAARASGNLRPLATTVGRSLFTTQWPAQVLNVYANGVGRFRVVGLHLSGTHFHHPLTKAEFLDEIAALAERAFAAGPVDEIDLWASVPLRVGKDVVVAGDLAKPTSRTVFTVSVERSEGRSAFEKRLRQGTGIFWDQDWARTALK